MTQIPPEAINLFTARMSLENDHTKIEEKKRNLKPLSDFVFFFALVYDCILIKTHNIESRCVTGPKNTLFAGVSVHPSAWKFYRLEQ